MTLTTGQATSRGASPLTVGSRDEQVGLRLDPETGLPIALLAGAGESRVELAMSVTATLVVGGDEVFAPPHGLGYVDTEELTRFTLLDEYPSHRRDGAGDVYSVATRTGDWTVTWEYTFRPRSPRLQLAFEVAPSVHGADSATLRDLKLEFHTELPDSASWQVEAPGNEVRPGIAAEALTADITLPTAGGRPKGSPGVVAVHNPARSQVLVMWHLCRTEIGSTALGFHDGRLRYVIDTGLAGRLTRCQSLRYEAIHLDLLEANWEQVRGQIASWWPGLGITTPRDRPDWITSASIFEVQIGYSPFWGGYRYAPYPDVRALLDDLDRIRSLGFDVIQVMPRQPYPSYNVHDYADITTSYGDEDDLRALVETCHRHGMRVILDILMHGVIDQEVMRQTADRVRSGELFDRLSGDTSSAWGTGRGAREAMDLAWSRHVLDFEPYWSAGSPPRHPLVVEHPEWFMRNSAQEIIGIYTKAFDAANPAWQDYFCTAAEDLVRRLDIDGFRIDAPNYNDLPNWSTHTRQRASYSPLGSVELFDQLRIRLKRLKPSAILYTEPSGTLFRQAMDVNYNYEEQWLIPAVLRPGDQRPGYHGVRNGHELAAWMKERNAVLPAGSLTAHHVDSHDTFWWPLPGSKWRREQFGLEATRAMLGVFALSGGAFMTFVGGEKGLEADIRRVNCLRADFPELRSGAIDYDTVAVDHSAVYAVARRTGDRACLVLVNVSDTPVTATCTVQDSRWHRQATNTVYDAWAEAPVPWAEPAVVDFAPYQIRVITVQSTPS